MPTKFQVDEKVRMEVGHREWVSATVVEETKFPRSVIVETTAGKKYRCNNIHLQRTKANIPDLLLLATRNYTIRRDT